MEDQIPVYEVDEDTQRLLETVLELASLTSNLQLDPAHQQNVLAIVSQTAARFGIEINSIQVVEMDELETEPEQVTLDWPFDIKISNINE